MTYFHVFWTRPQLRDDQPPEAQEIEIWDFEALTWLASVLEIRQHAPIRLITDSRGLAFVRKAGFDWAYNGGISTALDQVPRDLNPQIFWAAGKLYAYEFVEPPCVCFDTDLILWQPIQPAAPVMALHVEDNQWAWYRSAEAEFRQYGFDGANWNWGLHPVNTAVAYFAKPELVRHYTETATRFMREYSRASPPSAANPDVGESVRCDPMVFAEQRLLPMCADRLGLPIGLLRPGPAPGGYLLGGPDCTHLWTAKMAYKHCANSRVALVNFLIGHLLARHPESREALAKWKLDRPLPVAGLSVDDGMAACRSSPAGFKFSLLRNIRGVVWVEDPVSGVRRQASEGSMIWSVEIVRPESGASFELLVGGETGVSLRHNT